MQNKLLAATTLAAALIASQAMADEATDRARSILKETFPKVTIDNIEESLIKGLYEVQARKNVIYFHPETKSLVLGEIYKDGRNLTAEKREAAAQKQGAQTLAAFPYDKAIKFGNGKHKIIEITDPDCPYCRQAYKEMGNIGDVTKYVILAPLAHPQAITKCQYVIDAKDKEKAYGEMMSGKPLPADYKPSAEAIAKSEEMLEITRNLGVNGTPTFFINGTMVIGADLPKINKLLK